MIYALWDQNTSVKWLTVTQSWGNGHIDVVSLLTSSALLCVIQARDQVLQRAYFPKRSSPYLSLGYAISNSMQS